MKKIFLILLCVLLACALALSVSAEGSSVALTPSATTLERGATFTIVADLTNSSPIMLGTVFVEYDTNVFEMTGGTCHVAGANPAVVLPAKKVGTFFLGAETVVSGQIFTFNFRVKADAALGSYTFTPTASIGENVQIPATGTTITIACNHIYSDWTKLDDNQHQHICSKCNDIIKENHDWDDGVANPAPGCETPGTIKYTCAFCNATKEENVDPVGHKWTNDCDTTCDNNCGKTREVTHKYSTTYSNNKTNHWYACTVCGDKKDEAKHTPGPAATESSAQLCTVCNYEIAPILPHEHEISDEWFTDGQYHWHICTKTGCKYKLDDSRHVYDDNCDVTCNICNYTRKDAPHTFREELQANADGHWRVCAKCGVKSEVWEHTPGPEATETTKQVCTECNFILAMELSHVHTYGDTWYNDEECHWQSCEDCTLSTPTEAHIWDDGVEQEDGSILYTCSVCAHELTLSEPMASEPETQPTTPPATQKPAQKEEKGKFPWQWAGIAAIVLMLVGVVLLIIEFVRSRKTNMHGKFSK